MPATAPHEFEPDLSGHELDRYRLLRLLGVGGMGAVYEAEHTAIGKSVAVKLLRQQFSMHEIARKRFLREARTATRVEHPHVVDISDFGETPDGRVYFVMELLAGRDLGQLLEAEGRLPWPRARDLLLQIVSALGAAHAHGIVHRDMKPSNCFLVDAPGLDGRDFVKVLDFGIAKLSGKHGEETQGLTSTDEVFGTVGYMAPEMAMGVSDDPRSDVYAMGVMMYRMVVGNLPFEGGTAFQILARHVNEQPVPPRARNPAIPEGVERIILAAMAKRPEDRFRTMQDLAEAIRRGDVAPNEGTSPSGPHSTVQFDSGMLRKSSTVERTASLAMSGWGTGSWPTQSGGSTEVMSGPMLAMGSLSELVMPSTSSDSLPETEGDEYEQTEAPTIVDSGGGVGSFRLLAGLFVGMTAILATIAAVVTPSDRPMEEQPPTAPTQPRRLEKPDMVAERDRPTATKPKAEQSQAAVTEDDERHSEGPRGLGLPEEVEPLPETPTETETEQPKVSTRPRSAQRSQTVNHRPARSDSDVAARMRSKILERCKIDRGTKVTIEGIVGTGGRVLSPIVTPPGSRSACAKRIAKSSSFARKESVRAMPVVTVEL